jgi:integrase
MERNWSRSSWNQNKSALSFFMLTNGPKEAVDYLKEIQVSGLNAHSDKTSSQKLKRLTIEDLETIAHGCNHKSKWDPLLIAWLHATRLVGLRPSEWVNAELKNNILKVVNAKNTNERAFADERRLILVDLDIQEKNYIKTVISKINSGTYDYEIIYKSVRRRLNKLNNQLWPRRKKHITLYSGRHQFRANCASAGFSKDETAALMGHASNESAAAYYAQKSLGTGIQKVKPHPDDVALVIEMNKDRGNKKSLQIKKG